MPIINMVYEKKQGRLPAAYQEVQYIESSGTQYIDSGIPGGNGYITEAKFIFTDLGGTSDDKYILGSAGSYPNYAMYIAKQGWSGHRFAQAIANTWINPTSPTVSANTEYIVKSTILTSGNSLVVNGSTIGTSSYSSSYNNGHNLYIFASNGGNGIVYNTSSAKLYYLKMRQGSESNIVRDFVPCYRKSDSVIGLYDLVGKQFYTNIGTGTFIKGPDVN